MWCLPNLKKPEYGLRSNLDFYGSLHPLRKGEILRPQRSQVNLLEGNITLRPQETKNK